MSRSEWFTVGVSAVAIAAGFFLGGPVWGFIFLAIAIIAFFLWNRAGREEQDGPDVGSLFNGTIPDSTDMALGKNASAQESATLSAKLLRAYLIRHHPWSDLIDQLVSVADPSGQGIQTDYDLVFEVHVVNKGGQPVTVQEIVGEAQITGAWQRLKPIPDLSEYQLQMKHEMVDNPSFMGGQSNKVVDLTPSLLEELSGKALTRGVGYRGWLEFRAEINNRMGENPLPYRIKFIDALDEEHPIITDVPLPDDATLIHSSKVWGRRLSRN
ncbi:MAG: hypothetical protein WCC92_02275 [Candidatus Korobacteraceae bacterium]